MNLFYHDHLTNILPYNQAKKETKYNETKKQKQINKKCRDAFCFEYQARGLLKGSSPIGVWLNSYLGGGNLLPWKQKTSSYKNNNNSNNNKFYNQKPRPNSDYEERD